MKLFGVSSTSDYKASDYIKEAMWTGYFVIGVSNQELSALLKGMSYHMIETTRPVEVCHSVVDVDCKSHTNTANENNRLATEPPTLNYTFQY